MEVHERIKIYLEHKGLTYKAFDDEIEAGKGYIGKIIKTGGSIGSTIMKKIFSTYPELNPLWVFKGTGEMILKGDQTENSLPNVSPNVRPTVSPAPQNGGNMPLVVTVDTSGKENVVYVGIKARAGYLLGSSDPEFISHLPAYSLPTLNHGGTYRIFEADGVSMAPTISHGDLIVGRWVEDKTDIRENRIYVVVTRDGILIKRLVNRILERGKIYLKSDTVSHRREYPTMELDPSDILELWYAQMALTADFREPMDIYHRFNDLEADLLEIREELKSIKSKVR